MSYPIPPAAIALPSWRRLAPAGLILIGGLLFSRHLENTDTGTTLILSLWLGLAFGVLLQRTRFCFYCVTRDFIEVRDARGLLGILACLAVGTLGYHFLFGAFVPEPGPGRLPPTAHIGPVSWVLVLGSTSFGLGMAFAGSCISAQLYRFGEGLLSAPVTLIGAGIGFVLGFLSWNTLYLGAMQEAPVLWLPNLLGYTGSILIQLALLATVALVLIRLHRSRDTSAEAAKPWWERRWPHHVGGMLIGALAVAAYLRVAPLGVTAELGSLARTAADGAGLLPSRLQGLDTLRGCATLIKDTLWSNNGLFVIGLVLGSFASAWSARDFAPRTPSAAELARGFIGGVLMGWGGMIALGCTVGTLLSGIMAAAVSGWVFAVFCMIGLFAGWWLRKSAPVAWLR